MALGVLQQAAQQPQAQHAQRAGARLGVHAVGASGAPGAARGGALLHPEDALPAHGANLLDHFSLRRASGHASAHV